MLAASRFVQTKRTSPGVRALPPQLAVSERGDREVILMVGTRTSISKGASCLVSVDFPDRVLSDTPDSHALVSCMMEPPVVDEKDEGRGCLPNTFVDWWRRFRRSRRTAPLIS